MTVPTPHNDHYSHHEFDDPPSVKLVTAPFSETVTIEVELLSPMLGGGARAGTYDSDCWLRPSAVKGHLRFWWRALNAHKYDDVRAMRQRERELFGGPTEYHRKTSKPIVGPGLFVLRVTSGATFEDKVHLGAREVVCLKATTRATLTLRFHRSTSPNDRADILGAVRAWVVFGGIGGKTRRAFGAIRGASATMELPRDDASLRSYLKTEIARLAAQQVRRAAQSCFSLARLHAVYLGEPTATGEAAARLVRQHYRAAWKSFHQTHPHTLGGISPRHASPILLCVAATTGASPSIFPVILVTLPHAARHPYRADIETLTNYFERHPILPRLR